MATGTGKCTFGIRAPIDINMLNEIIAREVKFFRNYKTYRPNFKAVPVASKFYATHDVMKHTDKESQKIEEYRKEVGQARVLGPLCKYPVPFTTSHEYGWYSKPLVAMDRSDRRFYCPKIESIHTKIEVIIRMSNRTQKK